MVYDHLLVAAGTFGLSYFLFNRFPHVFFRNFYRKYPVKRFDNFLEINFGKSTLRPNCHKLPEGVLAVIARGIDMYGEHIIHTEISHGFLIGVPKKASDINCSRVVVELHYASEENPHLSDRVNIRHFSRDENILIGLTEQKSEISFDHMVCDDSDEDAMLAEDNLDSDL